MGGTVLVVDDEIGIRELLSEILVDEGYTVHLAENAATARDYRQRKRPDMVLLDIWMPDTDGITLLKEWAAQGQLTMPVVMMSGHGTIDTAVEATKIGAVDFLEKPIALQKLLSTIGRALQKGVARSTTELSLEGMGKSQVVVELRQRLQQMARVMAPVMLYAEEGAGAELCARALHQTNTPWRVVNDGARLVEAPLTLLEEARGGVLFFPHVTRLTKLEQRGLQVLLGKLDRYHVRLVCASTLESAEVTGELHFDAALWQQLNALNLRVPSLRDHREDVPELTQQMLSRLAEAGEAPPTRRFSVAALNALRNHDWPGNLTELTNAVRTLALTALHDEIGVGDVERVLQPGIAATSGAAQTADLAMPFELPLREARDWFEKLYLEYHLRESGGNMVRVAETTGLERTHLYRKIKQLGIVLRK